MIPVSKPIIFAKSSKYLNECINSGWISSQGPFVKKFERSFANYLGVKHAISTTSGTTALHLALVALGIKKNDEVIVPTFTMIAPVFAILYTGATPVFVDSDLDTWNMNVSEIERKITKKTKAILVVHIYGHPVDLDPIKTLAKKYKLYLIEDSAEALGAEYKNKKIGSFGIVSCFSFYANKLITTGEGGMVVTNNQTLAVKIRSLSDMSYSLKKRFLHTSLGFTYRMTNMQAALGLAQLENVEQLSIKKRQIAQIYNKLLSNLPSLKLPVEKKWAKNSYWVYGVLIKSSKINRDKLRKKLFEKGIDTRDFFIPTHNQPALKKLGINIKEKFPIAQKLSRQGLYLPSGPDISIKQIEYVCKTIKEIYEV